MNHGKTRSRSGTKGKSSKHASRDRGVLIALLVAIAVLLGVLVALLPDSLSREDAGAVSDERGGRSAPPAEQGGDATAGETTEEPERHTDAIPPSEHERGEDARAREGDAPAGTRTESYPAGEEPPVSPDVVSEDEYWWLPPPQTAASERGPLVLVLDDAGNSLDAFERFLSFPGPAAIAVLPQLDYSVQAAAMAAAAGKEILLHQPMEAIGGANPGPGTIGTGLSAAEIRRRLTENLASVPGAVGVNNHMGSRATAESAVMHAVLSVLEERGLFFLDSRTSSETVGRTVAAEVGIPFAERSVFLDNERTRESILSALRHALELSQRGAPVVMIGHATVPILAEVLTEVYPVLVEHGYAFSPLSDLVRPVKRIAGSAE